MNDLERNIDTMTRDRVTAKIQENAVRIRKINIRFTSNNKKGTLERLEQIVKSHERLVRDIVKEWVNVEKSARLKYRVPLDEPRKLLIITQACLELDVIFEKMTKDYQKSYDHLSAPGGFEKSLNIIRKTARDNVEAKLEQLKSALDEEMAKENVIPPKELCLIYGMEEQALFDMRVIEPLQKINILFSEFEGMEDLEPVMNHIQEALKLTSRLSKSLEGKGEFYSPKARKQMQIDIARAYMLFKDLVNNVLRLLEQLKLSPESRNGEMIEKLLKRIEDTFDGVKDGDAIVAKFKGLHDLLRTHETPT